MYGKIQEYKRQGWLKAEIARQLELDPATVAKYYEMSEQEYRRYRRELVERVKAFDEYKQDILGVYEANEFKKLTVSAVYDYLEERVEQLPGNEQTLRNYIRYLVATRQLIFNERARLYSKVAELPLGRQMQIDFGSWRTASGLKLYLFAAVLSASRYKYVAFQDRPFTAIDVIGHLLDSFEYFGGIAEQLVIDQDAVMVVAENHGDIIYTKDFGYFIQEMGLDMYVCRKADPESKGKIENVVGFVKQSLLSVRDFSGLEEAQRSLSGWLGRRANGKLSQATKRIPAEDIVAEREKLRPIRNSIYRRSSLQGRELRTVSTNGRICVQSCQYSVPASYRRAEVEIYVTEQKIFVFDHSSGEQIAEHTRSPIPGTQSIKREHIRATGKRTQQMRTEVLQLFALKGWKLFVEATFKSHHRYVRDQCIEAQRYFSRGIDRECLERALMFCLEHKTYTMASLRDTYRYYVRIEEASEPDILETLRPQLNTVAQYKRDIKVAKRDLGVYRSLESIITAVCL